MKITKNRITARRVVLWQSIIWVVTPFASLGLIRFLGNYFHFFNFIPSPWLAFSYVVAQPVAAGIVTFLRIRDGADTKLLNKWDAERKARLDSNNSELRGIVEEFQGFYYQIILVEPVRGKHCVFRVLFRNPVRNPEIKEARPILMVGGVAVSFTITGEREVTCSLERCLKVTAKEFLLECGGNSFVVANPYYMNSVPHSVSWQNEGHSHEKRVFIDANCFPYRTSSAYYGFDLLVQGQYRGTFYGSYILSKNAVVINIADVKKSDCDGRECVLRSAFDKSCRIVLPPPKIFAINTSVCSD